jgi:hypothetical protein
MNKRTFVPRPENLESRVVLSGGPKFLNGAAVLSTGALGRAYSQIDKAFSTFAHDGMNYGRLNADLSKAVNLIPYNRRDGLWDEVKAEVSQMQSDISSGVSTPVISADQRVKADLGSFVQGEVASGVIVIPGAGAAKQTTSAAISGGVVLKMGSLSKAYGQIDKAFSNFARHGMNYARLNSDLAKAVSSIPYNRRDGLWDEVKAEVSQMQSDISSGVSTPVISADQRVKADLGSFVQGEVASSVIKLR